MSQIDPHDNFSLGKITHRDGTSEVVFVGNKLLFAQQQNEYMRAGRYFQISEPLAILPRVIKRG